jgi:hypothetical protein
LVTIGFIILAKSSDYLFISFLALMSVVCGVTGINLIRMRTRDYLYSAEGSMVGGILSFTIGAVFAIWSYYHGVVVLRGLRASR